MNPIEKDSARMRALMVFVWIAAVITLLLVISAEVILYSVGGRIP